MKPNVVDVFCGVGGISRGFRNAGFNIILGIDSDEHVLRIFKKQFPQSNTIAGDVRKLKASDILEAANTKKIDVLVGGPPCQGFSMAGRRDPKDARNNLVHEFVRLAKGLKPTWVLMENVGGLATAKSSKGANFLKSLYDEFLPEFKLKHFIVNSADFGVPQKRRRIVIVGNSNNIDFEFQSPKMKWKSIEGILLDKKKVDRSYFYSKKLIRGFIRRERKNKERGLGFKWQFLKIDQPSYTIPARYWKDGANALVKYSENSIRMLTEGECAKIQTLDHRLFTGGKGDYEAIGNAAPPKMIQPFAEKILSYGFR